MIVAKVLAAAQDLDDAAALCGFTWQVDADHVRRTLRLLEER